ncbi:hypothetical protein V8E36_008481 [Tilletia maclaganii]
MAHDEDELIAAAREADGHTTASDQPEGSLSVNGVKNEGGDVKQEDGDANETKADNPEEAQKHEQRVNKLKFLLEKSSIYSRIMGERMEAERKRRADNSAKQNKEPSTSSAASTQPGGRRATRAKPEADQASSSLEQPTRSRKKRRTDEKGNGKYEISSYLDEGDLKAATAAANSDKKEDGIGGLNGKKRSHDEAGAADTAEDKDKALAQRAERVQPKLLTGAKMRDYQLDGLEWLVSLYENGLNGILADEMGLGKTIQTISFFAHLREHGVWGPFLVCAPLSTITNWVLEFERFTPNLPAILYYGTAPERAELRNKHKLNYIPTTQKARDAFPIVVSSYEIIMRDRIHLAGLDWKYIVVDEGHRLKNMNCKLVRELKTYRSANRLILTGTPLHNNLAELWSLLNFILPDIFDDLATFEKWFDFSDLHEEDGGGNKLLSKEQSGSIITQLHAILKPFLLRRLKVDVESDLPPKKEYLLYAPLTEEQKDLYEAILGKDVRRWLLERKTGLKWEEIADIIEGDWEDRRAEGYSYEKSARDLRQIHEDEEEQAAEAQILPVDQSNDLAVDGDHRGEEDAAEEEKDDEPAGGKVEDINSTRSSTTAVESPPSESTTVPGTPIRKKDAVDLKQPESTPRRSPRIKEDSTPKQTPPVREEKGANEKGEKEKRPRGRPRNDGKPAGSVPKPPPRPRGRPRKDGKPAGNVPGGSSHPKADQSAGTGAASTSVATTPAKKESKSKIPPSEVDDSSPEKAQYIVLDDNDEDEDYVMSAGGTPHKDSAPAPPRSNRYPTRRGRREIDYAQLDADFNEQMWRQIDAAEGGEEGGELGDRDQSRLDHGVAAWYSTASASGSARHGMAGLNERQMKGGPSAALVRMVGKTKANHLSTELQGKKWLIREAQKEINNLHLENIVMQLRKICCHPFLFDWPVDRNAGIKVVNEDLIHASGKMLMLNRLLDALFARGHKVLIFSQFTTMLDIMEDWATEYKGLRICRIDGSTSQELRRSQMKSFNEETGPDACNLFLLSTRAGGLGINLVAADTVIFYDSDWNPQMDLQAQDRVHRIGQKKPVLIFRLVSANTVEQKILKRAGNKRKLEALVIQQGKFKLPAGITKNTLTGRGGSNAGGDKESLAEMASALLRLDGERVQLARKGDEIISDANLERLLDRSPEAYQRQRGWVSAMADGTGAGLAAAAATTAGGGSGSSDGGAGGPEGGAAPGAFEVTSTEVEEDINDTVARLMAGEGQ